MKQQHSLDERVKYYTDLLLENSVEIGKSQDDYKLLYLMDRHAWLLGKLQRLLRQRVGQSLKKGSGA